MENEHKNKTFTLDKNYILAFSIFDGFTARLLSADLKIDWHNNFRLEMSSFETRNKINPIYIEEDKLPEEMQYYLNLLIQSDYISLKSAYFNSTFIVYDIGSNSFKFNFENETTYTSINYGTPIDYFITETEKLLFDFNKYLYSFIEEKYKYWRKN
jgi:hypothetical protein